MANGLWTVELVVIVDCPVYPVVCLVRERVDNLEVLDKLVERDLVDMVKIQCARNTGILRICTNRAEIIYDSSTVEMGLDKTVILNSVD